MMKVINSRGNKQYLLSFYASEKTGKRSVNVIFCKDTVTNVKRFNQNVHKKSIFALDSH